ncbi:MAG: imidazolonepropionase [Crenarchaeota archaeon 13_1_40CM_2_52_14]|nr:MAG: imidazolonepropionase [Crenarchaeota archaeon 13_1_40CM_3_52_17]OLD34100.1 MAG: imidazolonepropionase [Crenarchaeota archaeon 13_1_40CM_2_52_14]OLE68646.1 MAG: imidazolonepropionase [archaeon 13_1_20CM_2_51_12]
MAKKHVDVLILNSNETITLVTRDNKTGLGVIDNGGVAISQGKIVLAASSELLERKFQSSTTIDAADEIILPGFVDPHTHLVFAGARDAEFQSRIEGASYLDVLRKGGGIIETVNRTRQASSESLFQSGKQRLDTCLESGSTTVEIKSGYGLRDDEEFKILKTINRLRKYHSCHIVPTFMGAHAVPPGETPSEYVLDVIDEMLPQIARSGLADFCDVFCEQGAFDSLESARILGKARKLGLKLKIHADQFTDSRGAEVANKLHTTSADHLIHSPTKQLEKMAETRVTPVVLPASSLSTLNGENANARTMLALGLPVALGTDFSPSNWMLGQLTVAALASRELRMSAPEVVRAITINAARALGLEKRVGSLHIGKEADLVTLRVPSHRWIGYTYGESIVDDVLIGGKLVVRDGKKVP